MSVLRYEYDKFEVFYKVPKDFADVNNLWCGKLAVISKEMTSKIP